MYTCPDCECSVNISNTQRTCWYYKFKHIRTSLSQFQKEKNERLLNNEEFLFGKLSFGFGSTYNKNLDLNVVGKVCGKHLEAPLLVHV